MEPRSPALFLVSDLEPGEMRRETVEWEPDYRVELTRVAGPARAVVTLEALAGGIRVHGEADVTYEHSCYRCARTFATAAAVPFDGVFSSDPESDYRLQGEELDAEQLLRDELTLAMPLQPLCETDCAGLCPNCGFDLNSCACSGQDEAGHRPFAGLRELLDP